MALVAVFAIGLAYVVSMEPNAGSKSTVVSGTPTSSGSQGASELENLGNRIWIADVVFPPSLGWSSDWQDFGSGPHLDSVTRINSTTMAITAQSGGILAYSSPTRGEFEIILSKNYSQNNFSPGLRAGDVVVFRQIAAAESTASDTPTYGMVESDSVFCNVTLNRNGVVYHGFGTWGYFTGQKFYDPSPGTTNSVSGWVETPKFVLTFTNEYGWNIYTGRVFWTDSQATESVLVNAVDTSQSCTGYSLTAGTSRGTLSVEIPTLKLLLGTPCSASGGTVNESFGATSSNEGSGWAFIGVSK